MAMRLLGRRDRKRSDLRAATVPVRFEALEVRALLSASAGECAATQLSLQTTAGLAQAAYAPQQIRNAYGFDQISFGAGAAAADGNGQTIAIVDAYSDPNLAADLHVFDQQFGLNDPPSLQQLDQAGGTKLPVADSGWAAEISLDVEWAHAMAPSANILLVEANTSGLSDLLAAVDSARNAPGVSVVSMSWGTREFYGERSFDSLFTTPPGHQGVTFVASSGDGGSAEGPTWPASSGNVISVGGTSLSADSKGNYAAETIWSQSGQGASTQEPEPGYQAGVQNTGARVVPDVSFDADPGTGYFIYDSISDKGASGWQVTGGTSAGAPQWAALIAIANQGRATAGLGSLDGATQTLPALYQASASGFNAISQGTGSFMASAQTGYQPANGLGSPKAATLASDLGDAAPPLVFGSSTKPGKTPGHRHSHPDIERPPGPKSGPPVVPARVQSNFDRDANTPRPTSSIAAALNSPEAANSLTIPPAGSSAGKATLFSRVAPPAATAFHLSFASAIVQSTLLADSAGAVIFEQAAASLRAAASTAAPLVQIAGEQIVATIDSPSVVAANVVTNFIHVNALSAFCDATAAFINECATVPTAPAATPHRARAWLITAGVLAVDAILVAHWFATRPKKEDEQEQGDAENFRFPFFDGESLPDSRYG